MPTDTDPLTNFDDPVRLGRALADAILANALDDLMDDARDNMRYHFDLEDPDKQLPSTIWDIALAAYQARAEVLLSRIDSKALFAD